MSILLSTILVFIGFVLLEKGASFLIDSSSSIAKKFHISEMIIGLTIVALGTSVPELTINLSSTFKGFTDIQIGNIIGSNICNLLLILGVSSIIHNLKFNDETIKHEIPINILLTMLFIIVCNTKQTISFNESIVFLVLFLFFIIYTIILSRKEKKSVVSEDKNNYEKSTIKNIFFIILGVIILKFGGDLVVDNSINIARYFNISEKIISLTIIAVGTGLPELVTCIVASLKRSNDLLIGNIMGSNIFNILFILGTSAMIKPITYNLSYNREMLILFVSNFLLIVYVITKPRKEMSKLNGILSLVLYIGYIVTLFNY